MYTESRSNVLDSKIIDRDFDLIEYADLTDYEAEQKIISEICNLTLDFTKNI